MSGGVIYILGFCDQFSLRKKKCASEKFGFTESFGKKVTVIAASSPRFT